MSKKNNNRFGIMDIILSVVSLIYVIGIKFIFHPCAAKDDGSWMTCHWAGQAIFGIAIAIFIISVAHLLISSPGIKAGLSLAMVPIAALSAIIPGNLINLCMMEDMRCHSVMKPANLGFSVAIFVICIVNFFIQRASISYEQKWGRDEVRK